MASSEITIDDTDTTEICADYCHNNILGKMCYFWVYNPNLHKCYLKMSLDFTKVSSFPYLLSGKISECFHQWPQSVYEEWNVILTFLFLEEIINVLNFLWRMFLSQCFCYCYISTTFFVLFNCKIDPNSICDQVGERWWITYFWLG